MRSRIMVAAVSLALGGAAGAGVTALGRDAEAPVQMVGWKFDRNREGMLACRGTCERGGPHVSRFAVTAPPEATPEGCVRALKPLCVGALP